MHIVSGKSYVGSSINLGIRFKNYFNYNYLIDPKRNMIIHKALIKYGYSGFKLDILEFCNKDEIIAKEQHYINILNPEYNILKIAGSRLGHVLSENTKAKMRLQGKKRIYSEEHIDRMSKLYLLRSKESREKDKERMLNLNISKSHPIEVINVSTNEKTNYPSIRQAATELDVAPISIRRNLLSKKLLRGVYKISYVNNSE